MSLRNLMISGIYLLAGNYLLSIISFNLLFQKKGKRKKESINYLRQNTVMTNLISRLSLQPKNKH